MEVDILMPSEKLNRSYCDFCRIINHDIDASIVFEDDLFIAFLDHRPLIHGHCLVIPKRHIETFNNLPFELILFGLNLQLWQHCLNANQLCLEIFGLVRCFLLIAH